MFQPPGVPDPIDAELAPGERVLWRGRPDPSRLFVGVDAFLIPFSLLWAGIVSVGAVGVISAGAPALFALFAVPFVAVGAYLTVGRFLVKRARKRRTSYAITSARVLIVEAGRRRIVRELAVRDAGSSEYRPRPGGGDLVFTRSGPATIYANTGLDVFAGFYGAPIAFFDVVDIADAKAALERARAGA